MKMRGLLVSLVSLVWVWAPCLAVAAKAEALVTIPAGTVQLVEKTPPQNQQVTLALAFALQKGWHIYWKNPGEAGFPPSVSALPPLELSPLHFPPPQTLVQDGLKSNVLTGTVELPFTVTRLQSNDVQITARWLACASQCVPGQAQFTLTLSPTTAGKAALAAWVPLWLLAVLGGLVLNLMPCVFPVLAMKAVAFARLGGAAHGHIRREALGYSAGVVLSMLVLGGAMLGLRAAGHAVFWGFQFHTPVFVVVMGWILCAVGLSFVGLLRVQAPFFVQRLPAQNSFLTGLLAVLVATPCTAPFMGVAIAAAITLPVVSAMGLFLSLGLGMALPILLLGFVPHLASALPRPGRWMLWVQRVLALPLFASFIWLGWVLFHQSGLVGVLILAAGAGVLLAAALLRRPTLALLALVLLPFLHGTPLPSPLLLPGAHPYSAAALAALRAQNRPVFIDLTADWCITCQVNERGVLASAPVRSLFVNHDVAVLVGDWTTRNPEITALLARYHHAGVPLYLYYPPGKPAQLLPQFLTRKMLETVVLGQSE